MESDSDEDEEGDTSDEASEVEEKPKKAKPAPKKPAPKKVSKKKDVVPSDSESLLSELEEEDQKPDKEPVGGDDSSESEVLDESPKRKRKSKEASAGKERAKPRRSSGAKPAAELSADEAEIKKLQGQLVKCGVRKIWAFELKQYGDDSRAKIRHLRGMLKDVGMDGRFSEARAREIKERRELLADLEAVNEMNENWGAGGGRASRSRAAKPARLPKDDEDEGEGAGNDEQDDDDDDENSAVKARARGSAKYRADMAFLGDESESD